MLFSSVKKVHHVSGGIPKSGQNLKRVVIGTNNKYPPWTVQVLTKEDTHEDLEHVSL
jgi:hypothetical protein